MRRRRRRQKLISCFDFNALSTKQGYHRLKKKMTIMTVMTMKTCRLPRLLLAPTPLVPVSLTPATSKLHSASPLRRQKSAEGDVRSLAAEAHACNLVFNAF